MTLRRVITLALALLIGVTATVEAKKQDKKNSKKYSVWMADSEMERNPESWMLDFSPKPKWNYTPGLELQAILEVWKYTGEQRYFDYAYSFADLMVEPNGDIKTYNQREYNIDRVNAGKFLYPLYDQTQEPRLDTALYRFREQMHWHPTTKRGSFWHKKVYPNQVWLDGIYMACPFLAEYATRYNEPALFDIVVEQFLDCHKFMWDKQTGLYYHGWDESRMQRWADPETGLSANFWSRSIGWYMMAIVDTLDFIPKDHPKREKLVKMLEKLSAALENYRDPKTGMWYQVTDRVGDEGNYLESSGSIMFIYSWVKGAQRGYLPAEYLEKGIKAYDQFIDRFTKKNDDGTLSVTDCCGVAGLGGDKVYRDGSYEYYIGEPTRDNDAKTVGPFIMVSIMLDK